jgi:hypothetical protein
MGIRTTNLELVRALQVAVKPIKIDFLCHLVAAFVTNSMQQIYLGFKFISRILSRYTSILGLLN